MSVVVNNFSKAEDMEVVKTSGSNHCRVERCQGIAFVHEGLVSERGDGETFLHVSGRNPT